MPLAVPVAGSCGPGNLHLINGLYDANRSRVPVLAIAAHIPTVEIGTGYFQETHPQELFRESSVYAEYVADPSQMPRLMEIAMRAAIERRGVAVLVIPGDVALAEIADDRAVVIPRANPVVTPSPAELEKAATLLNGCSRVTILAGAGVEGAHDEVIALADALAAPIVHALRGKEHIEYDNPFDVGMTGLLGFASGFRAMEDAEALLILGSDFPYTQFYPSGATTIQVDIRGEQLGKRHPLDLGLVGDVKATAEALLPRLKRKSDRAHLDDATAHYRKTRAKLDDLAVPARGKAPIHPQYLARLIDEAATAGDRFAREFLAEMGVILGAGLASVMNLCDLHLVIVGGGMSRAEKYLLDPARRSLRMRALRSISGDVELRVSRFLNDAGMIGAAMLGARGS